jgi:tetratricopeptide (TPR) repeat protein
VFRAEQRERQPLAGASQRRLADALDSVATIAAVLEDQARARLLLDRVVTSGTIDSVPLIERNYLNLLLMAALTADSSRARVWQADLERLLAARGRFVAGPAFKAFSEGLLAFAQGRSTDALEKLNEADRKMLPTVAPLGVMRFIILARLQQTDSAIAAAEAYLKQQPRLSQDQFFLASMRQRLGELYETKGDPAKALEHYQAFVELWKNADPELQPRVRDARGRIDRLRAAMAKKG